MSKPKQWKQGRELKHADAWQGEAALQALSDLDQALQLDAYPQEAEQPDRLWVGSGDSQ